MLLEFQTFPEKSCVLPESCFMEQPAIGA